MRRRLLAFGAVLIGLGASYVAAQRAGTEALVEHMMAFDKNKDGRLVAEEVTDARLERLFQRADSNKDGVVTKAELTALAAREAVNDRGEPGAGPPGFGPPPPGGPMPGGAPGQILPAPLRERLGLTDEQRRRVDALQKQVDAQLDAILNADQQAELKQLRARAPRAFGPARGGPPGRPPR